MKKAIVVCAGGFGREVLQLLIENNSIMKKYDILGFVDDTEEFQNTNINGYPVIGNISMLQKYNEEVDVFIGNGVPLNRAKIYLKLKENKKLNFPNLLHHSIYFDDTNEIGIGNIICKGNLFTTNIKIGNFIMMNMASIVGHDAVFNDFITVSPQVSILGYCNIGSFTYLGANSVIVEQNNVGDNCLVGASSLVTKSVENQTMVFGLPAKKLRGMPAIDEDLLSIKF